MLIYSILKSHNNLRFPALICISNNDTDCSLTLMYDSTSKTTGLIQLIPDAVSIDGLKKRADYPGSLRKHFEKVKAI